MSVIEIGALEGEDELSAYAGFAAWAFGFSPAEARIMIERSGFSEVRVARRGGRLVGGLLRLPMGQWFGGRSVPMLGLAGVAVPPEARGQRVALTLVSEALREARRSGVMLSTLYPATISLYRAAGYELAGCRFRFHADCKDLPIVRSDLKVLPITPEDGVAVEGLYAEVARTRPGYLDRGGYVWRRVRESWNGPNAGYSVHGAGGLEGYVYLSQDGPRFEKKLIVHDLVATTARAAERLLALLADHRSTMPTVSFHGTHADALLFALPERAFRAELAESYMLRIVHAEHALAARGYPELSTTVDLELTDRVLPENSGRLRLEVSAGRAAVSRAGTGAVRLSERALAALYSGFLSPFELARTHELAGDAVSLGRLAALFAGPPPSIADHF
jgi:predicted acetyltransferase